MIDALRDHIIPLKLKYDNAYEMFKTLERKYEINNPSKTLALTRQLNHISINKGETINSYFMRIGSLRDQLQKLDYHVEKQELSMITLDGLLESWESFKQGINARDKFTEFDRLRDDCLLEESRQMKGGNHKTKDEDIHILNTEMPTPVRKARRENPIMRKAFIRKTCQKSNVIDVISTGICHSIVLTK